MPGPGSSWSHYAEKCPDPLAQADSGELAQMRTAIRVRPRAADVSRMERALAWQGTYLRAHPGPARVLALFLRCKVTRTRFSEAIRERRWSRSTAYAARYRALTLIAQGLNRDGVGAEGERR